MGQSSSLRAARMVRANIASDTSEVDLLKERYSSILDHYWSMADAGVGGGNPCIPKSGRPIGLTASNDAGASLRLLLALNCCTIEEDMEMKDTRTLHCWLKWSGSAFLASSCCKKSGSCFRLAKKPSETRTYLLVCGVQGTRVTREAARAGQNLGQTCSLAFDINGRDLRGAF